METGAHPSTIRTSATPKTTIRIDHDPEIDDHEIVDRPE
jgi:hypothetical protein